jgi:WD40 repeat protein
VPVVAGTQCGGAATFSAPTGALAPSASGLATGATAPVWSRLASSAGLITVGVSPDGGLLAVAGGQNARTTAQLWSSAGSQVATLDDGNAAVGCFAWSPDGTLLAGTFAAGNVGVWDSTGHLVRTLAGTWPVLSLAWSPDGTFLATGAISSTAPDANGAVTLPGVIRLWTRDGNLVQTLGTQFTGGKFLNLAWSPDGSMLAAGAVDYHVWRKDGTEVGIPRQGGDPAWAMEWLPDGSGLAIGDESGNLDTVTVTGTVLHTTPFISDVNWVSYSPDGHDVAVGLNDRVIVVPASQPAQTLWMVPTVEPQSIWSADGSGLLIQAAAALVLAGADGTRPTTLTGCRGTVRDFAWRGTAVVAVTDAGWICSWTSPEAAAP